MNNYKRYLKYENKYINLKNQIAGAIIDIQNERYDEHLKLEQIERIIPIANKYNRYHNFDFLSRFIISQNYDDKENEYKNVKTFDDLQKYTLKLIKSLPPYGTILNQGPLNNESSLILNYLSNFFEYDFITMDSQPGLIISDDNSVQRPYLFLYGSNARIDKLYDVILAHDFLAIVPYDFSILSEYFPLFTDIENYKQIAIGTRHINKDETIEEYYDKIFSDYFFTELLKIVKNI
jgi:hypothetical protein